MSIVFTTPACAGFLAHWDQLRGERLMPDWQSFSERPPFAHLRSTMVLEACSEGLRVRFMGTNLAELWGNDFTDSTLESFIEPMWHLRIREDVRQICGQPVGARIVGHTATSFGRTIGCESICLPLAVDDGRPPRCVQFLQWAEAFDFGEHKTGFVWTKVPEWIDLGAGLPKRS